MRKLILSILSILVPLIFYAQTVNELTDKAQEAVGNRNFDKAILLYNQAIALDSNNVELYLLRAEANSEIGAKEKAIADYTKTIALADENIDLPEIYYSRAFAYADIGNYKAAIEDFNKVKELDPDNRLVEYRILRVKVKSGLTDEVIIACTKKIEENKQDIEAYGIRSEAYFNQGKYRAAVKDMDTVLKIYPVPQAYLLRGKARLRLKDITGAKADFEKVLELKPDNEEAKTLLKDIGKIKG